MTDLDVNQALQALLHKPAGLHAAHVCLDQQHTRPCRRQLPLRYYAPPCRLNDHRRLLLLQVGGAGLVRSPCGLDGDGGLPLDQEPGQIT